MGKKSSAKKAQEPQAPDPASQASTGTWKDELTAEERAEEESKMEARKKKAEDAARYQQMQQAKRAEWERQQKNKGLEQQREDRKWEKQLAKVRGRLKQEGVVEAEDWGDGIYWANLGDGKYKEVKDQYFCTLCEKHLNDGTLESHVQSDAHKRKVSWSVAEPSVQHAPETVSSSRTPPPCPPCSQTRVQVEEWQELTSDGNLRCLPCNKCADYFHLQSDEHHKRLDWWLETQKLQKSGYKPPELPYLAWAFDDSDPGGDRWLKCLLCNKWVQDETSHSGTQSAPAGSKDHCKRLGNYASYKPDVDMLRNKYHPRQAQPKPQPPKQAPWATAATPAPWAKSAGQAAPSASSAPPPPQAPPAQPPPVETVEV